MKKKNNTPSVACKVSRGMFSTEREVVVPLGDDRAITALVDQRSVITAQDPGPGESVDGRVKVAIVMLDKKSALVDLPQAGFSGGPRIRIPAGLLDL